MIKVYLLKLNVDHILVLLMIIRNFFPNKLNLQSPFPYHTHDKFPYRFLIARKQVKDLRKNNSTQKYLDT